MNIDQLRSRIAGRVIEPGDPGYHDARTLFYGGMDREPAHIVRVAGAADVAHAIEFARESGLELAVRSGGHSVAGHSVSDGGVVIDLHDMRGLTIDASARSAWAETGLTSFDYTVASHEHGLASGILILPATADVIASFVAAAEAAPDELSAIANVMPAPPMPFLSPEQVGTRVILAMIVCTGPLDAAERAVAPLRSLVEPIADMLRPMPYPEIYPPEDPSYHPIGSSRTMLVDSVDPTVVMEHLDASTAKFQVAQIRVLGGAIARVPVNATAYAHRARRVMVNVACLYEQPDEAATHDVWAERFWRALQNGEPGAYVNFLGTDGPSRLREAYPGDTWDSLCSVKARYDPANVFRLNQNVPPRLSGAGLGS
jgi:FAD/FMN-containing dehydrogenase